MAVDMSEFWRLVIESRLLTTEECQKLGEEFGHVKGAAKQGNARTLSEWLISRNVVSRYQAKVLLGGRPGPFVYSDYKLYDRIKRGCFGGSFRAVHSATGHPVILRFLTGAATQDPSQWGEMVRRVQPFFSIVHPNIVRLHEIVDAGDYKFLVMEGVQGDSLDKTVAAAGGRQNPTDACRQMRQAALALAQLHQIGHISANVRPGKLWIEKGGNLKIPYDPINVPGPYDFRGFDPTGDLLEVADYLAPELAQPGKDPDVLTDIYALGCTLYEVLAGQPPFPGGNVNSKMGRHASEPIQPLDQTAGVPQPVAQVVAYMMAKNPAVRYQQATDVANALAPFVDHTQVVPQPAASVATLSAYETAVAHKRATMAAQGTTTVTTQPAKKQGIPIVTDTGEKKPGGSIASTTTKTDEEKPADDPEAPTDSNETPHEESPDDEQPPRKTMKEIFAEPNVQIGLGIFSIVAVVLAVGFALYYAMSTPENGTSEGDSTESVDSADDGETPADEQSTGPMDETSPPAEPPTDAGTQFIPPKTERFAGNLLAFSRNTAPPKAE